MLDKTIKELWDFGVEAYCVFTKSPDHILLEIKKDGKVYQRTVNYVDMFYAPGKPHLEITLNRYFKDALHCIKNDLKLPKEWTLMED